MSVKGSGGSDQTPVRTQSGDLFRIGPGVSEFPNLPVLPAVSVDYRKDPTSRSGVQGRSLTPPAKEGGVAADPGDPCFFDYQCGDCNPCTLDSCDEAVCVGGVKHGYRCDFDTECEGVCDGGGTKDGQHCRNDTDCCNPDPPPDPPYGHGTCVYYPCTAGTQRCINTPVPNKCDGNTTDADRVGLNCDCPGGLCVAGLCVGGARNGERCDCPGGACVPGFEPYSECDDTLECNGQETCSAGVCLAPTETLCDSGPPPATEYCLESADACKPKCTVDTHCNQDGLACTTDVCCLTPGGCGGGVAQGDCYVGTPYCGPGGSCTEPVPPALLPTCDDPLNPVGGRCCNGGNCTAKTYPACNTAGGVWLATGTLAYKACLPNENGSRDICPAYGSGIAPQGVFNVAVGPVVADSECNSVWLGDDYTVNPAVIPQDFMDIHFLRFAASVQRQARFAIEFWSSDGTFIEDFFYPDGTNAGAGGAAIHVVDINPPLRIPTSGFVVISIAANFGPEGAVSWLSTTHPADVGTNDPLKMFKDGVETGNILGECTDGGRDGQWCDLTKPADAKVGCPGGTCTDIPDVLAFEIVGVGAAAPTGACCVSASGTCTVGLPWECEAPDVFQGNDTTCDVCALNGFVSCDEDTDCWACDGGTRLDKKCGGAACPGGVCLDTACVGGSNDEGACNCPGGGNCAEVGPCTALPPACTLHACCKEGAGDCAIGFCSTNPSVFDPTGEPCNDYQASLDCPEGKVCLRVDPLGGDDCPTGWTGSGYGHDCEPNCCTQLAPTGGDNCTEVTVHNITVPGVGEPPVVVTVTGNNAGATFDEYNTYVCDAGAARWAACNIHTDCLGTTNGECVDNVCEGGEHDGQPCDPNTDCPPAGPPDGECRRISAWVANDPADTTLDPGWWEGFSIDAFANVRIELCCSETMTPIGLDVLRPGWANLGSGCPLDFFVASQGVPVPVGIGYGPDNGSQRGLKFCNDDNLWLTFGPLPPGTYYYPIYSAPQGTYAAPSVGGTGGTYQFNIIVGAPPEAACCLPDFRCYTPETGLGDTCNPDVQCPAGEHCMYDTGSAAWKCFDGSPPYGQACNKNVECAPAECRSCALLNEADCDAEEGYWLAGLNLPPDRDPVVDCGSPTGLCDIGSCCTGPGVCEDRATTPPCNPNIPSTCMDRSLCNGAFVGGPQCNWPQPACPVCSANCDGCCFIANSNWLTRVDRANGPVYKHANDFIPTGTTITEVCMDLIMAYVGTRYLEACEVPLPLDDWEIRFYKDNGGYPGEFVGGGKVEVAAKRSTGLPTNYRWDYSFAIDPPVSVEQGKTYWMEYSGVGVVDAAGNLLCGPWIANSDADNNGWSLLELDPDSGWTFEDSRGTNLDFGFCIDVGIEQPPTPIGSCCECDGTCQDGVTIADCMGLLIYGAGEDPEFQEGLGGQWRSRNCATVPACVNQGAGGCPGAVPTMGDSCKIPEIVSDGSYLVDTRCKASEGATFYPVGSCDLEPMQAQGNDWWFEYHSTCDGNVKVDTCGDIDYDAVLSVFYRDDGQCVSNVCIGGDRDGEACNPHADCPGGQCIGVVCNAGPNVDMPCYVNRDCPNECPGKGTCVENVCVGGMMPGAACTTDEGCYDLCPPPVADLDACLDDECANSPDATYTHFGLEGRCYLIRIAGWGGSVGRGLVDIGCEASCEQAVPAVKEVLALPGSPESKKIRYLSFSAGEAGKQQGIRVTFNSVPAPYTHWEGTELWVQQPKRYCENGGVKEAPQANNPPNYGCPSGPSGSGGISPPWFFAAELGCDPYWTDWTQYGTIHVWNMGIIPTKHAPPPVYLAQYDVRVINYACKFMPNWETNLDFWSDLIQFTQSQWADLIKDCTTNPCGPPDNSTGIVDVTAILDKFKNLPGNVQKVRADIEGAPSGDARIPNRGIDISDVNACLGAFTGAKYPPAGFPPAGNPPTCAH